MYRSLRMLRIFIALVSLAVPTWALLAGYESVFVRMQILTGLLTGVLVCLAFWLIVTLIYGRIYCSSVCPLGTAMDCTAKGWRMALRRSRDYAFKPASTRTRIVFFLILLAAVLSGSAFLPTVLDPYSAYARMVEELIARPLGLQAVGARFTASALSLAIVTAAAIIFFTRRRGRIICNTVCPVGSALGWVARRPVFHIEIDPDRCTNCGECERVCKCECINLIEKTVDTTRCVVCFDCTAACPCGAINYKAGRHRLSTPMVQQAKQ